VKNKKKWGKGVLRVSSYCFLRLAINGLSMLTARIMPAIGALAQGSVFLQPLYRIIVESSFS